MKTEIVVVMDRSGSMQEVRDDAIGGFNTFLEDQLTCEGEAKLTLIQFSTDYDIVCNGVPLQDVKPLTPETYRPRGWTAMLDAIIRAIDEVGERLHSTSEDERPDKVIFVILTDGEENSSKEYPRPGGYQVCKDKVTLQTDVYQWDFIFLSANQDAVLAGGAIGVAPRYTKRYTGSKRGTRSAFCASSAAVKSLRAGGDVNTVEAALTEVK